VTTYFQLTDDVLDYEEGSNMGKPTDGTDLKMGIITVPIYFAFEEDPAMRPLVNRRFRGPGDIEEVIKSYSRLSAF
jgi:hexaprenyl-diphosphate synthase